MYILNFVARIFSDFFKWIMSAYFHLYLKMSGSIVHQCSLRNPLLRRTFGEYRYNGHYCMWIESEDHNELKQKIHSSHCESAGKLFSYPSIADMIHDTWFTTLRLRLLFIDNPENLAEVLAFSTYKNVTVVQNYSKKFQN